MKADDELIDHLVQHLSLISQRVIDLQNDQDDYPSLKYYLKGRADALTDIIDTLSASET